MFQSLFIFSVLADHWTVHLESEISSIEFRNNIISKVEEMPISTGNEGFNHHQAEFVEYFRFIFPCCFCGNTQQITFCMFQLGRKCYRKFASRDILQLHKPQNIESKFKPVQRLSQFARLNFQPRSGNFGPEPQQHRNSWQRLLEKSWYFIWG